MIVRALTFFLVLALPGCGNDDGDTTTDGGTATGTTTTTTTATTDAPTTSTATTTASTTGTPTSEPTTGSTDATATGTSTDTGTGPDTGTGSTTGVDVPGFERFKLSTAAGPCPPNADCDGFVELLASGMLRVETFGDVTNEVKEVEISAGDFAAAVQVFADPDLVALLDGVDPLCDPPTDIFESMLLEIDKASHDATTTTCDQPPLAAARMMANDLRTKYVP